MRRALLVMCAAYLCACGSDDEGGGTGGTAGTSSGGSAGSSSGGSGGSATGGGAGVDAGGTGGSSPKIGSVTLRQSVSGSTVSYQADAIFPDSAGDVLLTCTKQVEGSCTYQECTYTPQDGGAAVFASAGTITITGGAETVTLTPESAGTYPAVSGQQLLWSDGASLTFKASGDTVPAFEGTVVGAGAVSLTAPTLVSGTPLAVDRAKALDVQWTGGGSGSVWVLVAAGSRQVVCTFAAAAGMGKVPTTLLQKLSAGSGGLSVSSGDTTITMAGVREVTLTASVTGAAGDITLQ
ncbi:MAG: hypothetical protein IPM35_05960 [Myxococcales bacterium]|nr:hypothetical protein [Myxococcales bacterium]